MHAEHTISSSLIRRGILLLLVAASFGSVLLSQTVTPASGGGAVSADNTGGTYVTLTGPVYSEAANGDVGLGTIILNVPSGFAFDTGGTAPTVLITRTGGNGGDQRNINNVGTGTSVAVTSVTTTAITFTVTDVTTNGVTNSLTWQNVRVRPTAGTPLAAGNITESGTSTMAGISHEIEAVAAGGPIPDSLQ